MQSIHDQDRESGNRLFHQLSRLCNIKRLRIIPYHPSVQTLGRTNESIHFLNAADFRKYREKDIEEPR